MSLEEKTGFFPTWDLSIKDADLNPGETFMYGIGKGIAYASFAIIYGIKKGIELYQSHKITGPNQNRTGACSV